MPSSPFPVVTAVRNITRAASTLPATRAFYLDKTVGGRTCEWPAPSSVRESFFKDFRQHWQALNLQRLDGEKVEAFEYKLVLLTPTSISIDPTHAEQIATRALIANWNRDKACITSVPLFANEGGLANLQHLNRLLSDHFSTLDPYSTVVYPPFPATGPTDVVPFILVRRPHLSLETLDVQHVWGVPEKVRACLEMVRDPLEIGKLTPLQWMQLNLWAFGVASVPGSELALLECALEVQLEASSSNVALRPVGWCIHRCPCTTPTIDLINVGIILQGIQTQVEVYVNPTGDLESIRKAAIRRGSTHWAIGVYGPKTIAPVNSRGPSRPQQ